MNNLWPVDLEQCLKQVEGSNILITGGAGFIGSHLAEYVCQHGAQHVVIFDNGTRPRSRWLAKHRDDPQIQYVEADILDAQLLDSAMQGVDVVFHLAAVATVMRALRDPELTFAVNALGTARVASAAQRAGVRRLVFSSSREVYGDPLRLL
jgi:nucleoside-diphosphate-sugar epimerase